MQPKNPLLGTIYRFSVVVTLSFAAIFFSLKSCGSGTTVVEQSGENEQPEPIEEITCGEFGAGETRSQRCSGDQVGKILEVCTANGWVEADNSCERRVSECETDAANKVTFVKDIVPLLNFRKNEREDTCLDCHSAPDNYGNYDVLVEFMKGPNPELIDRIYRGDARRMPKPPNSAFSAEQKGVFQQWLDDGLLKDSECADEDQYGNTFLKMDFPRAEQLMVADARRLDSRTRANSRYLTLGHRYNQRPNKDSMDKHIESLTKVLNTLSISETPVEPVPIDVRQGIFRLDLDDFELGPHPRFGFKTDIRTGQKVPRDFWDLVLLFEPFKFESQTTLGLELRELTGTDRPFLHFDNFHFTTMRNAALYYAASDTPGTLDELLEKIGVDLQQSFDDFEVSLAGGNGSPISLNKNRMIYTFETNRSDLAPDRGFAWLTQDPDDRLAEGDEAANLFEFPFPVEARSQKVFSFAAGEIIYQKSNGFLGFALFDSNGIRQDEAPGNVVQDTESNFDPVIRNPISCLNCHHVGIIPMEDQVRNSCVRNPNFNSDDKQRCEKFYPTQTALNATFSAHANIFRENMRKANVTFNGVDPANFSMDMHRDDWTLSDLCNYLFVPDLDECKDKIQSSDILLQRISTLLQPGGTITQAQVIAEIQNIKDEFRFGLEDIDQ